jgi:hypothetical protein
MPQVKGSGDIGGRYDHGKRFLVTVGPCMKIPVCLPESIPLTLHSGGLVSLGDILSPVFFLQALGQALALLFGCHPYRRDHGVFTAW